LWYKIDDTFKITKEFLKLALLEKVDLPLVILQLMSRFILDGKLAISKGFKLRAEVEKCIFTSFLIGTTIQDGNIRERSNDITIVICFFII